MIGAREETNREDKVGGDTLQAVGRVRYWQEPEGENKLAVQR